MKKNINIIITVIITAILIMLPMKRAEAASFTVSNSSVTLDVEKSTTITINASTHTGRINITSSNSNVASVNTNSIWVENNSQSITISAKSEGAATITIAGELYDTTIEGEQKYTQTIGVTVNKVKEDKPVTPEPEPETPTVNPEPEPEEPKQEIPAVEEKPNFTDTNKKMYASKDINLRASWSTSSKATSINKGTELTVTATSSNKVNGYVWYRVTYNGQILYVASNLLTETKPEEEKTEQEEPKEEPEATTEESKKDETSEVTGGLKSLEIEGLALTPTFSSNVYEYRVIVKENLSELKVNAVAAIENATITIAGNQNLQEGENLITIIVYNAKKEVEATYQITANKTTLDLSSTDKMLQIGTKEATRNLIIFIAALAIAIIVLIVVLILKHRNDYEYYDEEEEEFTDFEKNVENLQSNVAQDEYQEAKREKRKGKHF